ncbi:hypothetical protein EC968_001708 [Mortierella alpina]|nr:hypothetical protein EC968_001708 [Mortierella alpina]
MSSGAASASAPSSLGGTPSTTSLATSLATTSAASAATAASTKSTGHAANTVVSTGASPHPSASASATVLQDTEDSRHESVLLQKLLDISRHRHHSLTSQILGDLSAYNSNMEQDLTYIIKQYIQTKMSLEKSQAEVRRLEQVNAELVSSKNVSPSETQVGLGITSHQPSSLMHSAGTLQQQLLHMGQLHFQAIREQQSKLDTASSQLKEQQSKLDAAASQIKEQQAKLDTAGSELQMTTQELIRALEDVEVLKSKVANLETQLEALESTRSELESANHNKLVVNQQLAGLLEIRMKDLDATRTERDQARRAMDAVVHDLIETKRKFHYYCRMLAPHLAGNTGQGLAQGQGQGQGQGQVMADLSNTILPFATASMAMPPIGTFPANGPGPNLPRATFPPTNAPVGHAPPVGLLPYQVQSQPLVPSSGMLGQTPLMIQTPATGVISTATRITPVTTSTAVVPVSMMPVVPQAQIIPTTAMHISTPILAGTPSMAGSAPPTSFLNTAPSAPPSNTQLNTSLSFYGPEKAPKAPKAPKVLKAPKPKGTDSNLTNASPVVGKESSVPLPTTSKTSLETPAGNVTRVSFSEPTSAPTSSSKGPPSSGHRQPLAVIDLTANSTRVTAASPQTTLTSPSPLPPSSTALPSTLPQLQTQLQTQPEPQPEVQLPPEKESMGSAHVSHLLQEQQLQRQLKQQEIQRLQIAIKEIAERSKQSHQAQQERLNEREEQEHLKQIHETRIAAHLKDDTGLNTHLPSVTEGLKTAPGSNGVSTVPDTSGSSAPQGEKRQLEVDSGDEFENHRMEGGDDVTSPKRIATTPFPEAAVEETRAISPIPTVLSPTLPSTISSSKSSPSKPSLNRPLPSKASSITVASFQPVTERIRTAKFPAFEAAPSLSPLPKRLLDFGSKKKKQKRSAVVRIVDESEEEEEEEEKEDEEEEEEEEVVEEGKKRAPYKRFKPQPGRWYAAAVEIPPFRPRRADAKVESPTSSGSGGAEVGGGGVGVTGAELAEKGTSDRGGSTTSSSSSSDAQETPTPRSQPLTMESSKSTAARLSPSLVMRTPNTTLTPTGNLSQASKDVRAWVHGLSDDDDDQSTETDEDIVSEAILERGFRMATPATRPVQTAPSSSTQDDPRAQATPPNEVIAAKTQIVLPRTSSFLIKLSEAAAARRNVKAGSLSTIDLGLGSSSSSGEDAMETGP